MPSEFRLTAQLFLALFCSAALGMSSQNSLAATDSDSDKSGLSKIEIARPDGSTPELLLIPKAMLHEIGMNKGKPESVQVVVDVQHGTELARQLAEASALASGKLILAGKRGVRPRRAFLLDIRHAKFEHARYVAESYTINGSYIRDGEILGLQRFSYKTCPEKGRPLSSYASRMLETKPDDDPSPPGCFVKRSVFMATNVLSETIPEDPVRLTCTHTSCSIWMLVHAGALSTGIRREEIPLSIEISRLLKSTYISFRMSENES